MIHPIGILDSGVGGLSVWSEVVKELPLESTIYVSDSKNVPYGTKTSEEIYRLAKRLVEFLIIKQVKLIIVACNTITVSCLHELRNDYPDLPMIGTVPVVKTAALQTKNKRIGILSTIRTSESTYQKDLIYKYAQGCEVVNVGSDKLVPLIEKGITQGEQVDRVLEEVLMPFKRSNIDTLALGCTHYPFMESAIQDILGPEVQLFEPSAAIARHARNILEHNKQLETTSKPTHQFYTSGDKKVFAVVAKKLLGTKIQTEEVIFNY